MTALIHIVDDDFDLRRSLGMLVRSIGYRVAEHGDVDEFLASFVDDEAGCVVLDLRMPRMGGIELVRLLRQRGCEAPVIMISGHGDIASATRSLQEGAMDFLEKPFSDQRLLDQINAAVRLREASREREQRRKSIESKFASLSHREQEVLRLTVDGKTSAEAAAALDLSRRTIEMHRTRIMRKLDVGSFAELVRLAVEHEQAEPNERSPGRRGE